MTVLYTKMYKLYIHLNLKKIKITQNIQYNYYHYFFN